MTTVIPEFLSKPNYFGMPTDELQEELARLDQTIADIKKRTGLIRGRGVLL